MSKNKNDQGVLIVFALYFVSALFIVVSAYWFLTRSAFEIVKVKEKQVIAKFASLGGIAEARFRRVAYGENFAAKDFKATLSSDVWAEVQIEKKENDHYLLNSKSSVRYKNRQIESSCHAKME
jgi:uncharacterized membrane protein (UPF0182 family)